MRCRKLRDYFTTKYSRNRSAFREKVISNILYWQHCSFALLRSAYCVQHNRNAVRRLGHWLDVVLWATDSDGATTAWTRGGTERGMRAPQRLLDALPHRMTTNKTFNNRPPLFSFLLFRFILLRFVSFSSSHAGTLSKHAYFMLFFFFLFHFL